jgi:hypothetical protein
VVEAVARNPELEAAAFADFEDTDAWRVFADWLLSEGDPRGDLVSLAIHERTAFLSERDALRQTLDERESQYAERWTAWRQERGLEDTELRLRRGFVYSVEGPLSELGPVLDDLCAREPIQRLVLRDCEQPTLIELLEAEPAWISRLRYLKLTGQVGTAGCAALAGNPLPELRRVNFLGGELDDDACERIAMLETQALEALTLTFNQIGDAGVEQLCAAPRRSQWRELNISSNPIEGEGLAELFRATGFEGLEILRVRDIEAGIDSFEPLSDPAVLPGLKQLEFDAYGRWRHRETFDALRQRFGRGLKF